MERTLRFGSKEHNHHFDMMHKHNGKNWSPRETEEQQKLILISAVREAAILDIEGEVHFKAGDALFAIGVPKIFNMLVRVASSDEHLILTLAEEKGKTADDVGKYEFSRFNNGHYKIVKYI